MRLLAFIFLVMPNHSVNYLSRIGIGAINSHLTSLSDRLNCFLSDVSKTLVYETTIKLFAEHNSTRGYDVSKLCLTFILITGLYLSRFETKGN